MKTQLTGSKTAPKFRSLRSATQSVAWASLLVCLSAWHSVGQEDLDVDIRTNGQGTVALWKDVFAPINSSVVQVVCDGQPVALGTVVDPEGRIVTKASELSGDVRVRLTDGRELFASLIGTDKQNDLAVLKVDDEGLSPIAWANTPDELTLGQWVLAPGQPNNRWWMGVISAKSRPVPRSGGALGVMLGRQGDELGGVQIDEVLSESAADIAGIEAGDLVLSINGTPVRQREELIDEVKSHDAGDSIKVVLVRNESEMTLDVVLGYRSVVFDQFDRNQRLSGVTSRKRGGFEQVLQTDIPLAPNAMGGPLLTSRGQVAGISIARADRVSTYALPARLVQTVLERLLTP